MKTVTTWERLFEFTEIAGAWLVRELEGGLKGQTNADTKLGYAIQQKMQPRIKKAGKKYNSLRRDIEIELAVTDDKKRIVKDERGEFVDTIESAKAKKERFEKLYEESTYEIEPYFATELPYDLTDIEFEAMIGFVIAEGTEKPVKPDPEKEHREEAAPASVN